MDSLLCFFLFFKFGQILLCSIRIERYLAPLDFPFFNALRSENLYLASYQDLYLPRSCYSSISPCRGTKPNLTEHPGNVARISKTTIIASDKVG